jgi:hypothetical protein
VQPAQLGLSALGVIAAATALAPATSIALVPVGDGSIRARAVRPSTTMPSMQLTRANGSPSARRVVSAQGL